MSISKDEVNSNESLILACLGKINKTCYPDSERFLTVALQNNVKIDYLRWRRKKYGGSQKIKRLDSIL